MKNYFVCAVLALVFLPGIAVGVDTRYLDVDCGNNGDGSASTCAGSPGGAGAYNSASNAASDIDADCATAADQIDLLAAGTAADTTCPNFTGCITSSSNYIRFRCDPGKADGCRTASGTYSTSAYRLECADYYRVIAVNVDHMRVEHLQIKATGNDDSRAMGIEFVSGAGDHRAIGNLIIYAPSGAATTSLANHGISNRFNSSAGQVLRLANNIIVNYQRAGIYFQTFLVGTSSAFYGYNNTIVDSGSLSDLSGTSQNGLVIDCDGPSDTVKVRDNIIQNARDDDYVKSGTCSTLTTAKNITEDATSPDGASYQSKVVVFVDEASDDFHLSTSDTVAYELGDDLSADADFAFTTDFDRETRPLETLWDIGADEAATTTTTTTSTTTLPSVANRYPVFEALGEE
jgi:hypothetical protein